MTRIGSLFSGYGGLDMTAQAVFGGPDVARVVWHSDIKPAAVRLLEYRYAGIPNLGDITLIDPRDVAPVDVLTFGWPCQPHSAAGKRLGEADPRALWPHVHRLVAGLRPRVLLGENVARVTSNGELRRVVRSLAEIGYVGAYRTLRASDVGAPHRRDRLFLVAVRADAAADALGLVVWDEPGWSGRLGGAGAGVAGDDGAERAARLTLLPTPRASDGPNGGPNQRGRRGDLAMPSAGVLMDGRQWGPYAAAVERWEQVLGRPAPDPTQISSRTGKPQLAPAFVEWMMGLPAGWVTDVPGLTRSQQLSMLGDGVVPQQAAAAYAELLGWLPPVCRGRAREGLPERGGDMSDTWTTVDDEPRDVHPLWCRIWTSSDPVEDCNCGADEFMAGVDEKVALFEKYADGAA